MVLVVYFYELIVYMLLEINAFDSIAFFSQCSFTILQNSFSNKTSNAKLITCIKPNTEKKTEKQKFKNILSKKLSILKSFASNNEKN